MIDKFSKALVTMFGVGYFKPPGTAASFITCVIWYLFAFRDYYITPYRIPSWDIKYYDPLGINIDGRIFVLLLLILITFYSIIVIDKFFEKKDSPEIVIDEVVGQSIPLLLYFSWQPSSYAYYYETSSQANLSIAIWVALSFLFFRFLDIEKPPPIHKIDKNIKNGIGVMFDDIIAGFITCIPVILLHDFVMYYFIDYASGGLVRHLFYTFYILFLL